MNETMEPAQDDPASISNRETRRTALRKMNDAPKARLKELITKEGIGILQAPQRIEGWLAYSCPDEPREQEVLTAALAEGVPQALLQAYDTTGLEEALATRRAFASEEAEWAVQAWRDALAQAQESFDLFCTAEECASVPDLDMNEDRPKPPPFPTGLERPAQSWTEAPETWVFIGVVAACLGLILCLGSANGWRTLGVICIALGAGAALHGWSDTPTDQRY